VAILLDTNALLWVELGDRRLGRNAATAIDAAVQIGEAFICPISYWEVQLAIDRGRIALSVPITQWRNDHLAAGYLERATTGIDTIQMARLRDFHADPADRLITAVAINAGLTLLTADEKILKWNGQLQRLDSRL
jgi:PIN domain nuclease of toxin-antitoxin system